MPMLGDLLAAARGSAATFQAWLDATDQALAAKVETAAAKEGLGVPGFVRMAIADFGRFASEEDWATLTSSLRDSDDPGTICLVAMVDWRLAASGCAVHSHGQHPIHRGGAEDARQIQRSGD